VRCLEISREIGASFETELSCCKTAVFGFNLVAVLGAEH
jgi:hypothetical protein